LEFPIYRTYVTATHTRQTDRTLIERTIARARTRWQGTDADIFNFVRDALTLDLVRSGLPYSKPRVRDFALRMQQFTGPMAAKSLEDTALYRYHALLGLNEVGGDPSLDALSVGEFHDRMIARSCHARHGLTATATHDTKRGEDARARILALSELPDDWAAHVAEWRALNQQHLTGAGGARSPSAAHEYMIYQALIGAWPFEPIDGAFVERFENYTIKAAREGKVETHWLTPNQSYEDALRRFVRSILNPDQSRDFVQSCQEMAQRVALIGALNSLSQLALKATLPGVPDFYQGTETWDLSLVDPDNRRPVDFAGRLDALVSLDVRSGWQDLAASWTDGRIKLALTRQLLSIRNEFADVFRDGRYEPVAVSGPHRDHVLAYARTTKSTRIVVAVGRHFARVTDSGGRWPSFDWDTELDLNMNSRRPYRDALGNLGNEGRLDAPPLFQILPVTILKSG
jgi:(1->4)-alpha-D-glucan 1-alpha-D-glucosylmutase